MDAPDTVIRESHLGRWEMVLRRPHPALRDYVLRYQGYTQTARFGALTRHFPSGKVVLAISFGPGFRVTGPGASPDLSQHRNSFVAGLHDTYSEGEWTGDSHGIQVDFTPIGAHLFFRLPMHLLTNRVIEAGDLLGADAGALTARLAEAPAWPQRFAVLESFVARRLMAAPEPSPEVAWAWRRLQETGGRASIGALADEIGWSRKHLIARFKEQVGLPPKTAARVTRFQRAVRLLETPHNGDWTYIALDSAYYDQSHLIRDFHQFTGGTPTEFLAQSASDVPPDRAGDAT